MEHYKSVRTLVGTSYALGEELAKKSIVTDITIHYDEPPMIAVWTTPKGSEDERLTIVIPYHAVELLVK
jgi:hypothetical protein